MTRPLPHFAVLIWLTAAAGCFTTPLPIPPTANPEQLSVDLENGPTTHIAGAPGAVDRGDAESDTLRITSVGEPVDGPRFVEVDLAPDGSFVAEVPGSLEDLFYLELVTDDDDIFLIALRGGMDGPIEAVDPGPDADGDGSPDAIDCAPDDPAVGGRRCD